MQSNITIIVPVYNEQHTVIMLLEKLLSVFKNTGVTFQIIVVDDGSTDDTKKLLLAFQENHAHDSFTLMSHAHNKGKGAAIHTALEHAQGEYTIIQDADMEYDPSDIIALYSYAQQKNLPVLYGSRNKAKNERGQFFFYWGGRLVSLVTNVLFRQRLTDEATCYKLMNTKLLQSFPLHERGFAFCPEVTAHIAKQGIRIEEMAIAYVPRSKGHGKKINWSDGIKALWVLFQLRFPNIKTHLLVCALVTTAVLLYSTTWHKLFEGYEGETANAALKLFDGAYDVKRAGISAVLLYLPFVFLFRLFGMTSVSHLTIVPVIYSAMTIGLFFSIVWYLTKKKSISLIVSLLIMSGSLVWPYANIGMEYQVMFYLALMLFLLLRWKEGKGKLLWVAIVFALLSTAKSYGPIFGLPVVLFIFSVSARDRTKRALSVITPAAVVFVLSSAYSWYTRGSIVGVYSLSHEFQIWTWWEGFYGIFFSIGKGIFFFNPLLIAAFFQWRRFFKDHPATALYIGTSFMLLVLMTAPFSYWTDETLSVRKLVPIIGLLHLPLIYYFDCCVSWRKIQTWGFVVLTVIAVYVQILGASYLYGKQLRILRDGNLDSLHHMRFTPQLSIIPLYHTLLSGYLFNQNRELVYTESTWFRWTQKRPDVDLVNAYVDLRSYQMPDIYWLRAPYPQKNIFLWLIIFDLALILFLLRQYTQNQRQKERG